MAFFGIIVNFSLQILKSIHLVCLSFWDLSRDPGFRIFISVEKMWALVLKRFMMSYNALWYIQMASYDLQCPVMSSFFLYSHALYCISMSSNDLWCIQILFYDLHCLIMSFIFLWCPPITSYSIWCPLMSSDVHWCPLMSTDVLILYYLLRHLMSSDVLLCTPIYSFVYV